MAAPLGGSQALVVDGTVCLELTGDDTSGRSDSDGFSESSEFVGYDLTNGSGSFRVSLSENSVTDLGSDGRFIYVSTREEVVAIDPRTGSRRWRADPGLATRYLVADERSLRVETVDEGRREAYVRRIETFDGETGSHDGRTVRRPDIDGVPPEGRLARHDGRMYALWGSELVCLDRGEAWAAEIDPSPASLAVTADGAFVASGSPSTSTTQPALYRIDPVTGTTAWRVPLPGSGFDVAAADGTVVVRADPSDTDVDSILAIDAEDGSKRWTNHDHEVTSRLTVANGTVYVGRRDRRGPFLSAIGVRDGEERWRFRVDSAVGHRPVVLDGVAVLQCIDELICVESASSTGTAASGTEMSSSSGAAASGVEPSSSGSDCPGCGAALDGTEQFCPQCGEDLASEGCSECGAGLDGTERFCPECGHEVGR
jgi:outer membrane protein assembly factor BamB/RNA polymerase subunit RPABC4/transcription elongation factor Spt4